MECSSCCSQILQKERKNWRLYEWDKIDDVSLNLILQFDKILCVYLFFWYQNLTNKHRELPPHPNVVQMFGVSLDGPQPVLVLEYCAGGINQIKSDHNHSFVCEEHFPHTSNILTFFKFRLIRKFGQVVVWFKCEVEWKTQNSIDSRNCSRNASSSQSQHCSSWPCCKKYLTHCKWRSQNLCTFCVLFHLIHFIDWFQFFFFVYYSVILFDWTCETNWIDNWLLTQI
jgi:hypothetical protein